MITTRGMNTSGFTIPSSMTRLRGSNYSPSRFGLGIKTDLLGRTAAQRFGDYLRGEQLAYQKDRQERIDKLLKRPRRTTQSNVNQYMLGGAPSRTYKKPPRRVPTYAERRAADPERYKPADQVGAPDADSYRPSSMDAVRRAQQKAFDELPSDDPRKQQFKMVYGKLFRNNDNRYDPFLETPMTPTFNKPKQFQDLTERQKFNLGAFPQARPGTRFANNSGYNVVISNSLLGKTAGMQPPVNLSFIGSEY